MASTGLALFALLAVGCSSASVLTPADTGEDASEAAVDAVVDGPPAVPRLSVDHDRILDPDGKPIVLRGWNWGNWGTEQPEDAADNAAQGANVVRIPIRWWGDYPKDMNARLDGEGGNMNGDRLKELDRTIADATSKHLWVVLFADSNCGQASSVHDTVEACGTGSDGKPANFMNDDKSREAFFVLWKFLASRYANTPYIGMYELLPEPNFGCKAGGGCPDWSLSNKFYASLIPIVRAADPRTPILVGPNGGYEIRQMETSFMPGTTGIVYTGDLLQHAASDPASVDLAVAFRKAHDVPVFIQQVGVPKSNAMATDITNRVLDQLRDAGIGWTWWTYREPFSAGMGFAPYYGMPWQKDADWLATITSHFR
ncbi:MAG: glycoside hydrolase family 5 protein [Polyangiales bacterium]